MHICSRDLAKNNLMFLPALMRRCTGHSSPRSTQHGGQLRLCGLREVLLDLPEDPLLRFGGGDAVGGGDVPIAPQGLRRGVDRDGPAVGQPLRLIRRRKSRITRYPPICRPVTVPSKFFSPSRPNPARRFSSEENSSPLCELVHHPLLPDAGQPSSQRLSKS